MGGLRNASGSEGGQLRDQLAAERTLLAWIRTGLASMGFGFVVARFGLFLEQMQATQGTLRSSHALSLWSGTALIAAGVAVNAWAGWRHVRMVQELQHGTSASSRTGAPAVIIAFLLAAVGLALAIYLVTSGRSARSNDTSHSSNTEEAPMALAASNGIINKRSTHSVDETVEKLEGLLQAKGITVFALVDHSGEAEKAGMKMRPTKLVIFGSPKAGTPVMVAAPSIAIDLPLKILISEDDRGSVWLSCNDPAYLQQRHHVPEELLKNIAVAETLANLAAQ